MEMAITWHGFNYIASIGQCLRVCVCVELQRTKMVDLPKLFKGRGRDGRGTYECKNELCCSPLPLLRSFNHDADGSGGVQSEYLVN